MVIDALPRVIIRSFFIIMAYTVEVIHMPGQIWIGHGHMWRQVTGHIGNFVHQRVTDAVALCVEAGLGVEGDGLSETHPLELRRDVHGHKIDWLTRLPGIDRGQVHKALLKFPYDVVIGDLVFREYDDIVALLHVPDRLAHRGKQTAVLVDADAMGVLQHRHAQQREDVGKQPIDPAAPQGLSGPEVLKGIVGCLLRVHDLADAPDRAFAGQIQLHVKWAVGVGVIAYDDAGAALWKVLEARKFRGGIEEPHHRRRGLV